MITPSTTWGSIKGYWANWEGYKLELRLWRLLVAVKVEWR